VFGFEPRHVPFASVFRGRFMEADERVHSVDFTLHGFGPESGCSHVRVCIILQQQPVLMDDAPRQPIHELPTRVVAIARKVFKHCQQVARNGWCRFLCCGKLRVSFEQARFALVRPRNVLRWHTRGEKRASRCAPLVEVTHPAEIHRQKSDCCVLNVSPSVARRCELRRSPGG
jgi:hypothetical protein